MKLSERVSLPSQTVAGEHTGTVTGLTATTFTVTFDSRYAHVPRSKEDELKYDFDPAQGERVRGGTITYPLYEAVKFSRKDHS
jgi:hypothetical protein